MDLVVGATAVRSSEPYDPFRVLFIRVPQYFWGPKIRDPSLENYPSRFLLTGTTARPQVDLDSRFASIRTKAVPA